MKQCKLLIFLFALCTVNLTPLFGQLQLECIGTTSAKVQNDPLKFDALDFIKDNGFTDSLGNLVTADFDLELYDGNGHIVSNYFLSVPYNRLLTYKVIHIVTQQSCQGSLIILSSSGSQPLLCEDNRHYSISPGQTIEMFPSDFLQWDNLQNEWFDLEIKDSNGQIVVENKIGYSANTRSFQATVTEKATQNSCWTNFMVSAKTPSNAMAICDSKVTFSLNQFGKATIFAKAIDDGSTNYVSLALSRSEYNCDDVNEISHVKLYATGSDNIISQCTCEVHVQDKLAPVIAMKNNVNVQISSLKHFKLTPELIADYYDNCELVSIQVIPEFITCSSPNPTLVKLVVKDKSGATVSASTNVGYTIPNSNNVLVCNDQITVEVNQFRPIEITPSMVLEGSYKCNADLEVTLSYNNVNYAKPEVTWTDAGKTLTYRVTDKSTGNSCWGTIKIEKVENCNQTFRVCDTRCHGGDLGDCNSGYTDTDNVEWPCVFDLYVCTRNFADKVTPEDLQFLHGVDPRNAKPQIVNFDCNTIFMDYEDDAIDFGEIGSGNKKYIRSWTLFDWTTGNEFKYIQIFTVYVTGQEICDTLPWNTPAGDCAAGHTYNDAIEWPADITVSNASISLAALKANNSVHPNDVQPVLASSCSSLYNLTFNDVVTQIDATTLLISRTWSAFNTQTNVKITFVQKITLLTTSQASVCAFTYYDAPIEGVNMGLGNTDASGCASFGFIPDYTITPFKDGNARDGVDIMDLVAVYESVLGLRQLNPYQQLAADVSGTGGISTLDLVTLKNLVDGVTDNWPATVPVWRFLDKNHQIINGNITPINTFINTNNLIYGNEFIGIKMGDVNGSYNPDDNNHPPTFTVIKATDIAVNKGEAYELELKSDRNQNLLAVNLEFDIKDSGISVIDVTSNKLPGFNKNEHVSIKDGIVKISWFINLSETPQGINLRTNENFISFTFVSNKNSVLSDLFDLNEDASNQIKQSGDIDAANVDLYWESKIINGVSDGDISRLMIAPNPFTESVYVLGLDQDASYEIHNVSGQMISNGILPQSGLLDLAGLDNGFYLLHVYENGKKTSIHKLIKVE